MSRLVSSSRPISRRRSLPLVAVVAVSGVLLAACGGGKSAAAAGSGHSLTQVTIGKAVDTIGFTTVDVAQGKGFFAKEGVSAKEELMGGSSTAFAALQSGSVQFVTASSAALLSARAKGVPLEAVTSLDHGVSLQLIAANSWITSHHLSPNQPLNTVMKGLVGATLGVISTTDLAYNHFLMQAAGVSPKSFKFITLKTQAAALAALQHGEIDAFLLSPPNSYLAQSKGFAQIIATLHSVSMLKTMAYDILVVDTNYAKSHPAVVKAVATAMAMADNVMAANPSSVLSIEQQHYPKMPQQVLLDSLKYVTFTQDGQMSEADWQDAQQVAVQTGSKKAASIDVSATGGVWTNDYIKTADLSAAG